MCYYYSRISGLTHKYHKLLLQVKKSEKITFYSIHTGASVSGPFLRKYRLELFHIFREHCSNIEPEPGREIFSDLLTFELT